MKKPIKFAVTAVLFVLLVAIAVTAVGCGGKSASSDKISIKSSPRLEYLIGQDLDLSKGSILSVSGGKEKEIKLTASGVKVTGYDKNKPGKQTLTVSYGGQTCTFTVNVHGKIEAVDYVSDYVVGETFDVTQGKLLIYREDGVAASSVRLSDAAVTVSGTAFTQEGSATVTVSYKDETATISVNVYAPENVRLKAPNKLAYKSHETQLDVSGGYITVTANGGKMVKQVALTSDMIVGGFDPAAATVDNIQSPLEQQVTVRYLGKDNKFTVRITYSYVSYMRACANELSGVDLAALPAAKGERAIQALGGYFGLSADDKALLTDTEVKSVVRAAAVHGVKSWKDVVNACADTVTIDDKGQYTFADNSTYEGAKADYESLNEKKDTVAATADVLSKIVKEFADTEIGDGKTAKVYIGNVVSGESVRAIVDKLQYMLGLYDVYKTVTAPNDADAVQNTLDTIAASAYKDFGCTDMYDAVAAWHTAPGNMFEIFYDYCYDGTETDLLHVVCRIKLLGDFATLYDHIASSLNEWADLYDYTTIDTTVFMERFAQTETFAAELAAKGEGEGENSKTKWLYENMTFPFRGQEVSFEALIEYLRIAPSGYYANCHGALGDTTFDELWKTYTAAIDEQNSTSAEELLRAFVQASPSVQYAFLSSVYTTYNTFPHYNALPEHALDAASTIPSQFTDLIFAHYTGEKSTLPSACQAIFGDLMEAAEDYALRYYGGTKNSVKIDYLQQFLATFKSAQTKYAALSAADKTAFDAKLGYFYEKYNAIYAMYNADGTMKSVTLGDWKAKFDALNKVVEDVEKGYLLIAQGVNVYGSFVAGYEYAQTLAAEILASDNQAVLNAYYYYDYGTAKQSLESAMYTLRDAFVNALTRDYNWQLYEVVSDDFKNFMAKSSPVMQMYVDMMNYMWDCISHNVEYTDADLDNFFGADNKESVKAAIAAFYPLSSDEKTFFYDIDTAQISTSTLYLYDESLLRYCRVNLSADAYDAASKLLTWEVSYVAYEEASDANSATAKEKLKTAVDLFNAKYRTLTDNDKAEFDEYFAGMLAHYQAKYAELA